MPTLDRLIARLGISFHNPELLETALIHRSYLNERPLTPLPSNERLEFLGDAVLNYLTADLICARFPDLGAGELTKLRARLVRAETLAAFARELDLGAFLRIGRGEDGSGARERDSMLADLFEAVLAAIYVDQGLEAVRQFVLPFLEQAISRPPEYAASMDYKSRLQELVQADCGLTPHYQTIAVDGPAHRRAFTVEVLLGEQSLGVGTGSSKLMAAQAAAERALALGLWRSEPATRSPS